MNDSKQKPLVCILVYNHLCMFEYAIALEIFALPRPEIEPWYDYRIIAVEPGPITGMGGALINAPYDLAALKGASLIIVPGWYGDVSEALKQALCEAHAKGVRIATICSGVFLPAICGLLKGKQATTHWRYATQLQQDYPDILVKPDVLYVDEGGILTSAGSAAGIDLCLHIVRQDFGSKVANQVARRLVLPPHREGGQSQYIPRPSPRPGNQFSLLLDKIRASLNEEWSVERMAKTAKVSSRTLLRRFRDTTGESPLTWLTMERLSLARELLETTSLHVNAVAEASGFVTSELLRHHFKRHYHTSPLMYRSQFNIKGTSKNFR